ncbi:MAG: inositol monophosphatase [Calditrichaeota bacterium]|nr:inositol monophosphatase [Calditrichota bacterium]RQV92471.1 MAG: inositol monophosphatase [bacterium]RQV99001.1 MAG: inositol monophosphatase [Calditrichota bacterium]
MPDFINIAERAAREAGEILLSNRGKITPDLVDEKARNDFVTKIDHESERIIVDTILSHFPSHMILAEEGTSRVSENEYRWIIDPLDGTKNFIQDVPVFSISIALEKNGDILLGIVYDPVHDEMFAAEKGEGAYCNNESMTVSQNKFSQSLIATGFPFRSKSFLPQYLLCFEDIFLKCSGMRRLGSAAIDLCYTAMGRFEGFWELGLSIWDIAAGSLLIREAGGVVSDFWGEENFLESGFIIAGNADTHRGLLDVIKKHF